MVRFLFIFLLFTTSVFAADGDPVLIPGSTEITTLGTIGIGTWEATTVETPYGGTGQTTYTDGQILIGDTGNDTLQKGTLTGTANEIEITNGPGSATIGIVTSPTLDGTNFTGIPDGALDETYFLLGGRTGSQVAYFSDTSGEDGELHSNTSKDGLIYFGDNSYYDEANDYLTVYELGLFGNTAADTTSNLDAHWKQNDDSATTTVVDSMGSYDGTLNENTENIAATGKINGALDYDGSTNYFSVGAHDFATAASAFSISTWFYLDDFAGSAYPVICHLQSDAGARGWSILLSDQANFIGITFGSQSATWINRLYSASGLEGGWHHLVIVFDGVDSTAAGSFTLYLDNEIRVTGSGSGLGNYGNTTTFGNVPTLGAGNWWDGKLDDTRIYSRELAAADVAALWNNSRGTEETPAYYSSSSLGDNLLVGNNSELLGTLDVTGATTLNSTLNVVGATDLDSTLNVDGTSDFNDLATFYGTTISTISRALDIDVQAQGVRRAIPLRLAYLYNSTSLSSAQGGVSIANYDETNNNYAAVIYTSNNTSHTPLAFGTMSVVFTDHTAGSIDSDYVFALRNANSLNEVVRFRGVGVVGINESNPFAALHVVAPTAANIGLLVKGFAGQTNDMFQIRDSSNNIHHSFSLPGATDPATYINKQAGDSDTIIATDNVATAFKVNAGTDIVETNTGRIKKTTRIEVGATPYTALATDHIIYCDTDGGAIEIDLPAGVNGREFRIINVGSSGNDCDIDPNGAEQLYGGGAGVAFALHDSEIIVAIFETTENWW